MRRYGLGVFLCACTSLAIAAGPGAVRKQVEMSMLVTGTIDIQPDGGVAGYALDQPQKLPPGVIKLTEEFVPRWRFEPVLVDGKPVKARARMSLRVAAKKQADASYQVVIRNVNFGDEKKTPGESVTPKKMSPPNYPEDAYRAGIKGTVYLIVRVGRQGTVEDVLAEQTNLTVVGSDQQMERGRAMLSHAAVRAARYWTFNPPTKGLAADAQFWSVRVPVDFMFGDQSVPKYGQWLAYVPGPQQHPAWTHADQMSGGPDAMIAGDVYEVGKGLRLLTPPG